MKERESKNLTKQAVHTIVNNGIAAEEIWTKQVSKQPF